MAPSTSDGRSAELALLVGEFVERFIGVWDLGLMTTRTLPPAVFDLRELRQARGLSQEHVARLAGCSTSMVRQLERGYVPAGSLVLPRVIQALNKEGPESPNWSPSNTWPGTGLHGSG
jgi:DNA-binding XRE family transcriptional regulator